MLEGIFQGAEPLCCPGSTFSALKESWAGQQVGILGIGGLGHLAIQFAAKRGCIVTALSSSAAKEAEAQQGQRSDESPQSRPISPEPRPSGLGRAISFLLQILGILVVCVCVCVCVCLWLHVAPV